MAVGETEIRFKVKARELVGTLPDEYKVTPQAAKALGFFMLQQVKERFNTQGVSGGQRWPPKVFNKGGKAVLTGKGDLLNSFHVEISGNVISIVSSAPYAHVHQLGTIGKGGQLPTIVPRKAKALFIPLTERAKTSQRQTGLAAVWVYRAWGRGGKLPKAVRMPISGRKIATSDDPGAIGVLAQPLKIGRMHHGVLQVKNRYDEWEDGQPDAIFLKKVDIPPRPMLPDSNSEQREQIAFIQSILIKEK